MDKIYDVQVFEQNEVYIAIDSNSRGILSEIHDYFSFEIKNARFNPKVKAKMWDGRIRIFNLNTQRLYKGLLPYVIKFCNDRGYSLNIEESLKLEKSTFDFDTFFAGIKLPFKEHDFQKTAIQHCIENKRVTLLSPTSSGKSLLSYVLVRYFLHRYADSDDKILITVPRVDLVEQLIEEFKEYDPSFDIEKHCHTQHAGVEKTTKKRVVITTWQSVYQNPKKYFRQFGMIIVDEAHEARANSLKGILESADSCIYRIGMTGTLDDIHYNKLIIEGLCGPVLRTAKTKELMDRKIVSDLKIKCIVLKYDELYRKLMSGSTYHEEVKALSELEERNDFLMKMVNGLPDNKNTLLLVNGIDHAKTIYEKLLKTSKKTVYLVYGGTKKEQRSEVRRLTQSTDGVVIVATYGVYSTGISIKNLQYLIFGSGTKSIIRLLQSIGRGLRKDGKDDAVTVFDIVDYLQHKKTKNYTLKHFFMRVRIYNQEEFTYTLHNININVKEQT